MNYKNNSLDKMADKLVKAMEAKEYFDKREQEKSYIKKLQILKEVLTQEYKFASQNKSSHPHYASKIEVIQKDINYIKKIQNNKSFETSDMEVIDTLLQKYTG